MDELVLRIREPELCYVFARNAERNNRKDLVLQAHRRAVDLRTEEYGAETEAEYCAVRSIFAYEEALSFSKGKRTRATGTWQVARRMGVFEAVARRLQGSEQSQLVPELKELGMSDYTFDAVRSAYPEMFEKQAA